MKPVILFALWICLGTFVCSRSSFAAENVVITAKAREHFKAGVAYIEDPTGPKYEEAYREFHIAYAESPTYKILTNIGLCALNLERDGEAIDAYERFLVDAKPEDIPKDKRILMERDIAMLKASLVRVTLRASPSTVVVRDERLPTKGTTVTNRYELSSGTLALGIHPGHHRITVTAEGYEPQIWDFEADSATTHEHTFTLLPTTQPRVAPIAPLTTPPEPRKKPNLTGVYVGAATTGVFAVTATVLGLVQHAKKTDYDTLNRSGSDPNQANDLRKDVKSFAIYTDIALGAAVLSAGATVFAYITAPTPTTLPPPQSARLRIEPNLSPSRAGLSVSGQF
jgi:hypothetical protein